MLDRRRLAAAVLLATLCAQVIAQVRPAQLRNANGAHLTVFGVTAATGAKAEAQALPRLDASLRSIARASADSPTTRSLHALNPTVRLRLAAPSRTPEVLVDIVVGTDPVATQQTLQGLGLRDSARASNLIGGWLPVTALAQVAQLPQLNQVRASMPRTRAAGPLAVQGDFVQGSSAARARYPGLTGQGINIGVISDSFNCYGYYAANNYSKLGNGYNGYATNGFSSNQAEDILAGALPKGVVSLGEAPCANYGAPQLPPYTDEGRAMAQIVYAVAPGAQLAFRTAANSEADFAAGITQMQKAGINIIVDDVGYPDEPFFQDGVVAQAVDAAAAQGVLYVAAAGNDGRNSYETSAPGFITQGARRLLNFDTSGATTSTLLPITIPPVDPGEFVILILQWDQPYVTGAPGSGGAANALNFCIENSTPATDFIAQNTGSASIVTYPVCTGANSIGVDPYLILAVGNPADQTAPTTPVTMNLSVQWVSGAAPGRVKFLLDDNGLGATIDRFSTQSPTIQGHPNAAGAVAVAAAMFYMTPACGTSPAVLESYSSYGNDPVLFDAAGKLLATPVLRAKPEITAPDAINDTFLGFQLAKGTAPSPPWNSNGQFPTSIAGCQNNSGYPNFFGTSAAAPHLAGAAALLMQANPALSRAQIMTALTSTALPMAEGREASGAGFVQVTAALDALPLGPPLLSISPAQITAGTPATLTWSSFGTRGCTASGAWSGAQASAGTVTVTPAAPGMLTYALACTGDSGTSSPSSVSLEVQSAAGHHGGGGAPDAATLVVLLALLLLRLVRFRALE